MKGVSRLVVAGVQAEIPPERAMKIIRVHSMFSGGGVAFANGAPSSNCSTLPRQQIMQTGFSFRPRCQVEREHPT